MEFKAKLALPKAKLALPKAKLALPNISGKASIAYKMVSSQSQLCLKIKIIIYNYALEQW